MVKILADYKNRGSTILVTTQHASLFSDIVDDIIILKKGKTVYKGPLAGLSNNDESENAIILKTSDRFKANEILQTLSEVKDTYVSQKAVHVYLKEGVDLYKVMNALAIENLEIKKIINKKQNLDKLIGEFLNAN